MKTPELSAREIAARVRRGDLAAEDSVRAALSRIAERSALNAVVHRMDEAALSSAREIDRRRTAGAELGPLAGVPVAVKDNIATKDAPTTCASRILAGCRLPYDATAVARLRAADAVIVGKTNCDEFGMGSSNESSCHGAVRHPLDPDRTPGGSSGGSAVVVADRQVPLALGSDTGGSVRQPAAFCGVVGVKPSYGRVSRWGLVAFGSSLDQIGPLARDVRDAALALATIAGADPRDATCATGRGDDFAGGFTTDLRGRRVGLIEDFYAEDGTDPEVWSAVRAAADALSDAGATVDPVRAPLARAALAVYYLIATSEASSNLARFDGVRCGPRPAFDADLATMYERHRGECFGAEVKRRIMLGVYALSAGYHDEYYGRALRARHELRRQLDDHLARLDLLLLPTAPTTAFRLGEKTVDPLEMYSSDVFTVLASLGGHPAISVPAPRPPGALPIGVQLIGPRWEESSLLSGAAALEERGFRCA